MKIRTYVDTESFLRKTQSELELDEAANSLMLGVCLRLARCPEQVETNPCLKTIEDQNVLVCAAMMTPPHKLVVFGHQGNLDTGARTLVTNLVSEGWSIPGVMGPEETAERVAKQWAEVIGERYILERRQRVYELRGMATPVPERGRLRLATAADAELVARWRYEFRRGIFGEAEEEEVQRAARRIAEGRDIYLWEDGRPVSMAMKTRPTRKGISISSVYTPPELRRRGYATACVGELSRMLLGEGWEFCALFADLANTPANCVYERIGYKPVCDYDEYVFSSEVR